MPLVQYGLIKVPNMFVSLGQLCVNYNYYDETDTVPTCAKEAAIYNFYMA